MKRLFTVLSLIIIGSFGVVGGQDQSSGTATPAFVPLPGSVS